MTSSWKKTLQRGQQAEKAFDVSAKKRRRRLRYCNSSNGKSTRAKEGEMYKSGSF